MSPEEIRSILLSVRDQFEILSEWVRPFWSVLAILITLVVVYRNFLDIRRRQKRAKQIEETLSSIESRPTPTVKDLSLIDAVKAQVQSAIDSQTTNKLIAERRAGYLYSVGLTLLQFSVFCPIIAAILYWNIEPLSGITTSRLLLLKNELGVLPGNVEISVLRDWRILAGGVTFGFLCLAAAKGILGQRSKELLNYSEANNKIDLLSRMLGVILIKEKIGFATGAADNDVADFFFKNILSVGRPEGQGEGEEDSSSDFVALLKGLLQPREPRS